MHWWTIFLLVAYAQAYVDCLLRWHAITACHLIVPRDWKSTRGDNTISARGLPRVISISGDIKLCIYGCDHTKEEEGIEHDWNLLEKWSIQDLWLLAKELQFKLPSVTFIGNRLSVKGVEPNPTKVVVITGSQPQWAKPEYRILLECANTWANFVTTCLKQSIHWEILPETNVHFFGQKITEWHST